MDSDFNNTKEFEQFKKTVNALNKIRNIIIPAHDLEEECECWIENNSGMLEFGFSYAGIAVKSNFNYVGKWLDFRNFEGAFFLDSFSLHVAGGSIQGIFQFCEVVKFELVNGIGLIIYSDRKHPGSQVLYGPIVLAKKERPLNVAAAKYMSALPNLWWEDCDKTIIHYKDRTYEKIAWDIKEQTKEVIPNIEVWEDY